MIPAPPTCFAPSGRPWTTFSPGQRSIAGVILDDPNWAVQANVEELAARACGQRPDHRALRESGRLRRSEGFQAQAGGRTGARHALSASQRATRRRRRRYRPQCCRQHAFRAGRLAAADRCGTPSSAPPRPSTGRAARTAMAPGRPRISSPRICRPASSASASSPTPIRTPISNSSAAATLDRRRRAVRDFLRRPDADAPGSRTARQGARRDGDRPHAQASAARRSGRHRARTPKFPAMPPCASAPMPMSSSS